MDDVSSWEERMATRAASRRPAPEPVEHVPTHLHGSMACCPCGAEYGITCVYFDEDYVAPTACETCGKPIGQWCNLKSYRDVEQHFFGCPTLPDATRCAFCGGVIVSTHTFILGDPNDYHFGCAPGAQRWDDETKAWRDREGNLVET